MTEWRFFDPAAETFESSRNLPHWDQTGALTFVTMRLADSMPKEVVKKWHEEIESWLRENNLANRKVEDILNDPNVDARRKQNLKQFKFRRWHGHLDDCHGECPLRDPKLAAEVGKSLLHFHGTRYDLERFIVMPNHVHILIQMRSSFELRKELAGVMRFNGRTINRMSGNKGEFWQSEPFDHVVRSQEQFHYLQNYIYENPHKANLNEGEFLFWKCGDELDSEIRAT